MKSHVSRHRWAVCLSTVIFLGAALGNPFLPPCDAAEVDLPRLAGYERWLGRYADLLPNPLKSINAGWGAREYNWRSVPSTPPVDRTEPEAPPVQLDGSFLVIDISGGIIAENYPVSHLTRVPDGGWTDEYKTDKIVLRRIPAGTFIMGSPPEELGRLASERPHPVQLTEAFYIGVFEVTQRQWELVLGNRPSYFNNDSCYMTRPVEVISYYDLRENPDNTDNPVISWPANDLVKHNSFFGRLRAKTGLQALDLPTEAQWEYACRAGTQTSLNAGRDLTNVVKDRRLDELGRYWSNGGSDGSHKPDSETDAGTAPVGSYRPNAWGLYDMHGNVYEWCLDWHGDYPEQAVDPRGVATGTLRTARGGSWDNPARYSRSAVRLKCDPAYRNHFLGFRIAMAETAASDQPRVQN